MRVSPAPPSTNAPPTTASTQAVPPASLSSPASAPTTASGPHSPHMSPAVGGPGGVVMPPHPTTAQGEGRGAGMHAPGYPGGPQHMGNPQGNVPMGYPNKMSHPVSNYNQPGFQQGPPGHAYPPAPRPQGSGPLMQPYPGGNYTQNSGQPPGHQYPPRGPHNNHLPGPPGQSYGYFGQGWGHTGPGMPPGGMPGKGGPPGQPGSGANSLPPGRGHGPPPHYMKHPVQPHKMYAGPPGLYPNGPGPGPGGGGTAGPPSTQGGGSMPPPTSTPQPMGMEHQDSAPNNGPPSSNSTNNNVGQPPPGPGSAGGLPPGGVSPAGAVPPGAPMPPSIGPDGNPIVDEASQQSTVSNNSAASGDDRAVTPKLHKDSPMGLGLGSGGGLVGGGPNPPFGGVNSAQSPGSASMTSQQDELENLNSPGWPPRSPTSGPPPSTVGFANNQPPPPPEIYRPTKVGDSISRLYEMSDNPDRRAWLDKLLSFMEENKTPITTCPTISKNPLDLYNLYLHVKERGGFLEVTKNKQWKDVAAVMGIGASSSGSYTLRKHYMKHIVYYECKFDQGGIDPLPIIKQVETTTKKKNAKNISVPSPGSSNSQDSFPPSNSNSLDGFSNGPHHPGGPPGLPYPQYPPSSEYPGGHGPPRPQGASGPGYQGYSGNQYPGSGYQSMHSGYPNQPGYPPNTNYPPDSRGYSGGVGPPGPPNHAPGYQPYGQQGGYQRPGYPSGPPGGPPGQQNYGGQDQYSGFQGNQMYPPQKPGPPASPGPPQSPGSTQGPYQGPRRHPDFEKGQQPPGWRGNSQYGFGNPNGQAGPPGAPAHPGPPGAGAPGPGWNPARYPAGQGSPYTNQNRWQGGTYGAAGAPRAPGPTPHNKNYVIPPTTSFKSGGYGSYMGKQLFPVDSVEAVLPVLSRRKRMTKANLPPVDPWKLLMSLRCGLAAEVTWALDVLNVLLFDDHSVVYFGLQHMPGLLEVLIEHLRRGLLNMFDICAELETGKELDLGLDYDSLDRKNEPPRLWYERPPPSPTLDLDLGVMDQDAPDYDPEDKEIIVPPSADRPDFTLVSKTGKPVKYTSRPGELFIREGTRSWDVASLYSDSLAPCAVGGGESTDHIVCSMQSAVTLRFARVLAGKQQLQESSEVTAEPSDKDGVKEELKDDAPGNSSEKKYQHVDVSSTTTHQVSATVVKMETEDSQTQKCNGPEKPSETGPHNTTNASSGLDNKGPQNSSGKDTKDIGIGLCSNGGKVNNTKTSKLDMILKRIKRESPSPAIPDTPTDQKPDEKSQTTPTPDGSDTQDVSIKPKECAVVVKTEPGQPENKPGLVHRRPLIPAVRLERRSCIKPKVEPEAGIPRTSKKRPHEDLEEEAWSPDEASLSTTNEGQDWLARRVMCIGTVIRNLSFVPGNDDVMSRCAPLLALLGKTILLHHDHPDRSPSTAHYDRDDEGDLLADWCSSLTPDTHWWWPYLYHVHENTLVTLTNMSTNLDLSYYPEEITLPILDGLLHWATCPASYGQDPLPGGGSTSQGGPLSPQRLALEALVKLCVLEANTDLVLATPPFSRLDSLCSQLTRMLSRGEDQVLREFSINLLHYFSQADSGVARVIAMQNGCVSLLISFIEEAEAAAMNVANVQGISALKENPELMGTSLDMVRRAANTLVYLSRVPDNSGSIATQENRLLTLVMSQILDTYVASQLSQVLFNVAQVQVEVDSPDMSILTENQDIIESRSPIPDTGPGVSSVALSVNTDSPRTGHCQGSPVHLTKEVNGCLPDVESGYASSATTSDCSSTTSSSVMTSAHSPLAVDSNKATDGSTASNDVPAANLDVSNGKAVAVGDGQS